ncbi:MAG: FAD-dependent oxidoreductase [Ignavibacteria bacterium]|nr:FAD-dependent oxidoreductase [Ignavibacteria bacterium]
MKTPIFRLLRRAIRTASANESRRDFLRTASLAGAATALPSIVTSCGKPAQHAAHAASPRIAIIGAGIAGLSAAYHLHREGIRADVYEASHRVGGRILSSKNLLVRGAVTELGGELIDSTHADILTLAHGFGLELIDLADASREGLHETYFFNNRTFREADVVREIRPLLKQISADVMQLSATSAAAAEAARLKFDRFSIESYFSHIGLTGWIRSFLETAFVAENGLELGEQSALNFLETVGSEITNAKFSVYGSSDERYRIRGGNQQITDRIAALLGDRIFDGHVLESIKRVGSTFSLSFKTQSASIDVAADVVILALPFTVLRNVNVDLPLPHMVGRMISELRYGSNAKVLVGFDRPFWTDFQSSGTIFSDLPIQLSWENTAMQNVDGGGLTFFSGGSTSRAIGSMKKDDAASMLLSHLHTIWPESAHTRHGRFERIHWSDMPFALGSYSSFGPNQWTSFQGLLSQSFLNGTLYFAGEHCSDEFRGYMNGAAASGRHAARKILAAIA